MLCARYLVASEQMERSGPVAAAVRAAGYTSEDEAEEEEEGSSVEEEQDAEDDEVYEQAREMGEGEDEAGPPEYTHGGYTTDFAHNGYPVRRDITST